MRKTSDDQLLSVRVFRRLIVEKIHLEKMCSNWTSLLPPLLKYYTWWVFGIVQICVMKNHKTKKILSGHVKRQMTVDFYWRYQNDQWPLQRLRSKRKNVWDMIHLSIYIWNDSIVSVRLAFATGLGHQTCLAIISDSSNMRRRVMWLLLFLCASILHSAASRS